MKTSNARKNAYAKSVVAPKIVKKNACGSTHNSYTKGTSVLSDIYILA